MGLIDAISLFDDLQRNPLKLLSLALLHLNMPHQHHVPFGIWVVLGLHEYTFSTLTFVIVEGTESEKGIEQVLFCNLDFECFIFVIAEHFIH